MGEKVTYSKRIHIVVLCCFLLPFFYVGCDDEKRKELQSADTASVQLVADTVFQREGDSSLVLQDTIGLKAATPKVINADTLKPQEKDKKESEFISKRLSDKYTFLQPILVSNGCTYSGIAIVLDNFSYISFFSVFLTFLFLLLSLLLKFIESKAQKAISLMNIIAFVTLNTAAPMQWYSERVWGYFITLILVSILMIFDQYILKQSLSDGSIVK